MTVWNSIGNFFKNTDWNTVGQKTTQSGALLMNAAGMAKQWGIMTGNSNMSMQGSIFGGYMGMGCNPMMYSSYGMGMMPYNYTDMANLSMMQSYQYQPFLPTQPKTE